MRKMVAKRMSARDWLDRDSVRKFEWIIGLDEVRFPVMGHIKDVLTIPSCLLVPSEKNKASPEEFIWILSLLDLVLTSDYMLFENLKKRWRTFKHRQDNNIHKGSRVYLSKESIKMLPIINSAFQLGEMNRSKDTLVNEIISAVARQARVENKSFKMMEVSNNYLQNKVLEMQKALEAVVSDNGASLKKTEKEFLTVYTDFFTAKIRLEAALILIEDPVLKNGIEALDLDKSQHDRIKRYVSMLYSSTPDIAKLIKPT